MSQKGAGGDPLKDDIDDNNIFTCTLHKRGRGKNFNYFQWHERLVAIKGQKLNIYAYPKLRNSFNLEQCTAEIMAEPIDEDGTNSKYRFPFKITLNKEKNRMVAGSDMFNISPLNIIYLTAESTEMRQVFIDICNLAANEKKWLGSHLKDPKNVVHKELPWYADMKQNNARTVRQKKMVIHVFQLCREAHLLRDFRRIRLRHSNSN